MSNYLLEIGLEEMPAKLVTPAVDQLAERMAKFLTEERVSYKEIVKLSTPRRLALFISGIADESEAMSTEVKGPAAKIAKDAEGNWSKAIQGFSRGQGVNPDDLVLKDDYYYAEKHIEGLATTEILTKVGEEVIKKMQFQTYMKWGNNDFLFIRPIQWLVSLFNSSVVPFEILDNKAGRTTRGHRFLANLPIELVDAQFYEKVLQDNYVIAYAPARKLIVAQEIMHIVDRNKWQVTLYDDLLEEVNNLVEFPTAFVGKFDPKYLELPEEVLVTSMRDNQRYFEVRDESGKLLPNFISVRNGNEENIDNVIRGNEKVLVARLDDADFFWKEDQKLKIADLVEKLNKVTFHVKIGSLSEHMARTAKLAAKLADALSESNQVKKDLARAAEIYKFDLLTSMVGEFAELQGIMGEKYALIAGENEAVSQAIREHYMPISADGDLPASITGSILAVADKLDSLNSFFKAGLIPSGSNDPYALRRATAGIIRIIEANQWSIDLKDFIEQAELVDFVKGRIAKHLEGEVSNDIIDAVLAVDHLKVLQILEIARLLNAEKAKESFKPAMESITRVINITKKNHSQADAIDGQLFIEAAENQLFDLANQAQADWSELNIAERYSRLVETLAPAINDFFDHVMVMAEDEAVKNNRLALLEEISELTSTLADFSLILTK